MSKLPWYIKVENQRKEGKEIHFDLKINKYWKAYMLTKAFVKSFLNYGTTTR